MRNGLKLILFIIVLLMAVVSAGAQVKSGNDPKGKHPKKSDYEFRVGWITGNEGSYSISLFDTINKDLQYHVFSLTGRELFYSTRFKKVFESGCEEDEKMVFWSLTPDAKVNTITSFKNITYPLVIGTSGEKVFHTPNIESISKKQQDLCYATLLSQDTMNLDTNNNRVLRFHSAGTAGGCCRVFVEQRYGLIAVCQIVQDKCEILYAYSKFSNELVATILGGQADLNSDGLCDVFALNSGDYGGKWVLVNENGRWILFHENGPTPC